MITPYTMKLADEVLKSIWVEDLNATTMRTKIRSLANRVKDLGAEPTIEDMQNDIMALGWVFQEQTFPNGDVILKFKQTTEFNPYANSPLLVSDGWNLGWGRFPRRSAWTQAHDYIVNGNPGDL